MKYAIDTSVLVASLVTTDKLHGRAKVFMNKIQAGEIEYGCVSRITLAEMGYILERLTHDAEYAHNSIYSFSQYLNLEILDVTWDFITTLAHLKAINPISFCDNATLAAAQLTNAIALFTKEKAIVTRNKSKLTGPEIVFLEDLERLLDHVNGTKSDTLE